MKRKPKERPDTGFTGDGSPSGPELPILDPLRRSLMSKTWVGITVFAVILILITDFVLENTNSVKVSFLFWTWHTPLAVALMFAVAGGILATSLAGTVRILQLRRRVRKSR